MTVEEAAIDLRQKRARLKELRESLQRKHTEIAILEKDIDDASRQVERAERALVESVK